MGEASALCRRWVCDSRDVCPGDAFVALRGERYDGHDFLTQAIDRGARLILSERHFAESMCLGKGRYAAISVIAVDDTLSALTRIASEYLRLTKVTVIGITGSVGKTTTRELACAVLKSRYKVHSAVKSYNTAIGCSLTALAMPSDTDILILEFGANHFGEIREMVSFFPPSIAVITEIAQAHLEGFGSREGVLRAKLEITESADLAYLIYNADNGVLTDAVSELRGSFKKYGVGFGVRDGLSIESCSVTLGEKGALLACNYCDCGEKFPISVHLFGRQHAYNVGYAAALGRYFGIETSIITASLKDFSSISGRGVCHMVSNNMWIIDESYNANPLSLSAAIDNVLVISGGRRYKLKAVLGGMRELGQESPRMHEQILKKIAVFDSVVLIGSEWETTMSLPSCAERFNTFESAIAAVCALSEPNSIILVKGSNVYGLNRAVMVLSEG